MIVAVAILSGPPPQHSPIFGHRASSHTYSQHSLISTLREIYKRTVWRFRLRRLRLIFANSPPTGTDVFNHAGNLNMAFLLCFSS